MNQINKISLYKALKTLIPWIAFFALLLFTLKVAYAQSYLGGEWDQYLNNVKTFAPTSDSGEALAISFVENLIRIVRNVVGGIALVMGVLYGVRLVVSRGQEEVISKQKNNFLYALLGFMILIIAENVARIFNPEFATADKLIDFGAAHDQFRDIANYMKWLLGSIAVLMFGISSIRLIVAQGEEDAINTQKRNLTWSLMGLLLVLLASNIVNAVYVIQAPDETVAAGAQTGIMELVGIIRLILVFMGPAAIAFTIYAGFMYLTALDNEERAKKGKEMIVAGVVAIVIIYGAYAIVNTLTSADLALLSNYLV